MATPEIKTSREEVIRALERRYQVAERDSFLSCMNYLQHVVINCVPPRPFRQVADPWQWALASKVAPAVEFSAQVRKQYDGPMKFLFVFPKGHDKTSMIGRLLNWGMGYAHTHLTAYAAAKDREQAGLLMDSMLVEANLNPWLKKHLQFKNWKVHGRNDSKLHIMAADAEGSAGIRGDLLVLDELSQWKSKPFFDQLMSGYHKRSDLQKRSRCTLIVISNAGVKGSWQWDVLQEAIRAMSEGKGWYVYQVPEGTHLASWMSEEALEEARRMIPAPMARMLYDNAWVDPNEENQYVTRDQAEACEATDHEFLLPRSGACYAAVDYGPVKDRTALAVVRRSGEEVWVEELVVLQGSKERHVPVSDVEAWLDRVRKQYPLDLVVFDKYQMESTIQKYRGVFPLEVFEPRGSSGNYAMAENLRHLVVNKKIRWARDCGLLLVKDRNGRERRETFTDEIVSVGVKVTPGGYRIFNPPNSHDDRTVAVGMASLHALRATLRRDLLTGDVWW